MDVRDQSVGAPRMYQCLSNNQAKPPYLLSPSREVVELVVGERQGKLSTPKGVPQKSGQACRCQRSGSRAKLNRRGESGPSLSSYSMEG